MELWIPCQRINHFLKATASVPSRDLSHFWESLSNLPGFFVWFRQGTSFGGGSIGFHLFAFQESLATKANRPFDFGFSLFGLCVVKVRKGYPSSHVSGSCGRVPGRSVSFWRDCEVLC